MISQQAEINQSSINISKIPKTLNFQTYDNSTLNTLQKQFGKTDF